MLLSPARRYLPGNKPSDQLFGIPRSRNVLEEFSPTPAHKLIKVLFLSNGDVFKALQTAAGQQSKRSRKTLEFSLIHTCPINMARNILLFKIISHPDFNPEAEPCLKYLWSVWYNCIWTKEMKHRFVEDVQELLKGVFPVDAMMLPLQPDDLLAVNHVFTEWLNLLQPDIPHSPFIENLRNIRSSIDSISSSLGITGFPEDLKEMICKDYNSFYFADQNTDDESISQMSINPTLLDPKSKSWLMDSTVCPFSSYLPLDMDKLLGKSVGHCQQQPDGLFVSYCQKRLKHLLVAFRQRRADVTFSFHLGDPLEMCYAEGPSVKFDVVDCSGGLADQWGLANVLNAAERRLSDEPESVLLTDTSEWSTLAPTVIRYVEEALCAPLSMLPTMYGLRLTNPIQREPPLPTSKVAPLLVWRRTPRFENLLLDVMPSLQRYLEALARKCIRMDGFPADERCGMKRYTPSTLMYVLRSAAERLGRGYEDIRESFLPSEIPIPRFQLALRTLRFWTWISKFTCLAGRADFDEEQMARVQAHITQYPSLSLVSAIIPPVLGHFPSALEQAVLCVLLVPTADLQEEQPLTTLSSNVHQIDHVDFQLIQDEPEGVLISFVLVSDHGLEETHSAVVVDLLTGCLLVELGPLKDLWVEPFRELHPLADAGLKLPASLQCRPSCPVPGSRLHVESCLETEDLYVLLVRINCDDNVEGFTWITDRQQSYYRGTHWVTLRFARPVTMPFLTLTFPHPFLIDTDSIRVELPLHAIRVSLKKALHDPWPGDMASRTRWNSDSHKTWQDSMGDGEDLVDDPNDLFAHLDRQFERPKCDATQPDALFGVRTIIGSLFELGVRHQQEFITIVQMGDPNRMPELWIRLHLPIRTTPHGAPMIVLSAYDQRLATQLMAKKKLTDEQDVAGLKRIFVDQIPPERPSAALVISSDEEVQLLRQILRRNAAKMSPTAWQDRNLPKGKHSPWLVTFLSPLYADSARPMAYDISSFNQRALSPSIKLETPPPDDELMDTAETIPTPSPPSAAGEMSCARCRKVPRQLRKCGGCREVHYCSTKCQREDSAENKSACPSSSNRRRSGRHKPKKVNHPAP